MIESHLYLLLGFDMGSYTHRLSMSADHETADLAILPNTLGLTAKRLWKAGEMRRAPDGRIQSGNYKNSFCSLEFEPLGSLPDSLSAAVEKLKPHKKFLVQLSENDVKFQFFIGWFSDRNSGDRLEWTLLRDIADLRIALDFDFYGPDLP